MTDKTPGFTAEDRVTLVNELYDEVLEVVQAHGLSGGFTVSEVVGVLEQVKFDILMDSMRLDEEDDDEESS